MLGLGEWDSKTGLMRTVSQAEMMLLFIASITGVSYTANIPMGVRSPSQDTTIVLCIKK
jgi:hypothetical protein